MPRRPRWTALRPAKTLEEARQVVLEELERQEAARQVLPIAPMPPAGRRLADRRERHPENAARLPSCSKVS